MLVIFLFILFETARLSTEGEILEENKPIGDHVFPMDLSKNMMIDRFVVLQFSPSVPDTS